MCDKENTWLMLEISCWREDGSRLSQDKKREDASFLMIASICRPIAFLLLPDGPRYPAPTPELYSPA